MDDMSFAWLLRVDGRGFSFDAALITRAHGVRHQANCTISVVPMHAAGSSIQYLSR